MRIIVRLRAPAPIFFNKAPAREQLLKHGEVYTLRRKRKSVGETTAREGDLFHFKELGRVKVEPVGEISECSEGELGKYLPKSGFRTVEDWCAARAIGANWLYLVKKA